MYLFSSLYVHFFFLLFARQKEKETYKRKRKTRNCFLCPSGIFRVRLCRISFSTYCCFQQHGRGYNENESTRIFPSLLERAINVCERTTKPALSERGVNKNSLLYLLLIPVSLPVQLEQVQLISERKSSLGSFFGYFLSGERKYQLKSNTPNYIFGCICLFSFSFYRLNGLYFPMKNVNEFQNQLFLSDVRLKFPAVF